jgi:hypothetical protein
MTGKIQRRAETSVEEARSGWPSTDMLSLISVSGTTELALNTVSEINFSREKEQSKNGLRFNRKKNIHMCVF